MTPKKNWFKKNNPLLINLKSAASVAFNQSGAKAWRLAELSTTGFPVPEGWVITDAAFKKFCHFNEIMIESDQRPTEKMINQVLTGDLPPDLEEDIRRTLESLPYHHFAVRSSSAVEDNPDSSMAGQFITCLNVPRKNITAAVKKCWSSLFRASVQAYLRKKSSGGEYQMGVIIQRQIHPRYSGVIFTIDPIKNTADYLVIEWVKGLGEKLVSGKVNPNRLYIHRESPAVPAGIPAALADSVIKLCSYALKAEGFYHQPIDMEWCVDQTGLYILQARPVTTFSDRDRQIWSNVNMTENFPQPLTPFTWSMVENFYTSYIHNILRSFGWTNHRIQQHDTIITNMTGIQGGRIYYNLSNWYKLFSLFPFRKAFVQFLNTYIGQNVPIELTLDLFGRSHPSFSRRLVSAVSFCFRLLFFLLMNPYYLNYFEKKFYKQRKFWRHTAYSLLSLKLLSEELSDILEFVENNWRAPGIADLRVMIFSGTFEHLTKKWITDQPEKIISQLLSGIKLKSTEPSRIIWQLARLLKKDQTLQNQLISRQYQELEQNLSGESLQLFREFMEKFGSRCYHDCLIISPTFEERHDLFWNLVEQYQHTVGKKKYFTRRSSSDQGDKEYHSVVSRLSRIKKWIYLRLISQVKKSIALRERGRLLQSLLFGEFRQLILEIGKKLQDTNILCEADDIFFLNFQEINQLINGKFQFPQHIVRQINDRRETYQQQMAMEPPRFFLLKNGEYLTPETVLSLEMRDTNEMSGIGVSSGIITGISRVILDPTKDDPILPGEILITRTTDPGWTPLFLIAGGLILERGGLLSHGAIVAREFGIPAVVGVNNAIKIGTGKKISVDGTRGIIKIIED